jgi:hypothetical protein
MMPTLEGMKAERIPILTKREKNRGLKTPAIKVEKECNAKLSKLNIAIRNYEPPVEPKADGKDDPLT